MVRSCVEQSDDRLRTPYTFGYHRRVIAAVPDENAIVRRKSITSFSITKHDQ
jgi:hypothetical protein